MNDWNYEPASNLDRSTIERLRQFPREPEMFVYAVRSAAALAMRLWLRTYHRLEITGRENLVKEGSFVMVANHTSHLDTLCLLSALPLRKLHRTFPAAAEDYFFVSVPRIAIASIIVNALPFSRRGNIRHSLELCSNLLANPGNILILFPEGSRRASGEINEFKSGVGVLVAGTRIPVVPCYLQGGHKAWPKGGLLPRPRKLKLKIGKPRTYEAHTAERESFDKIAADLRQAVCDMATLR